METYQDPKNEVLSLKMLLVKKDLEFEEMKKCKEGLQKEMNNLSVLLKRCETGTLCNIEDDPSSINSQYPERNLVEELQKFGEEIERADRHVTRINQFEQNEVVEQLLISNDDLSNECQQLKKKLIESESALVFLEDQLESLRSAKLRETERTNSLACELALTQAKALHLEQLAHVEVGRMMSGSSSSFRSGSIRQNSFVLQEPVKETSSLLREPVKETSSLLQESVKKTSSLQETIEETQTEIPVLRPTIVKVHSCVDEVSPPQVTQKRFPEKTEVKLTDDFNLRSNSSIEDGSIYISPNVVIKQKVNFNLEDIICGDVKSSSVNFSDMDDDELCQYQLKLLEARDNDKMDMNPGQLEAQIDELNFYMSGQSRMPEPVTTNPCFVKFSVKGWGATLAKVRSYFLNFRGVTGVKVADTAVFITFNNPKEAQAVVDKNPHVVGGCHLVPGPVVVMEAENEIMRSEVDGVKAVYDEVDDAEGTMAVFDEPAEEIDPIMARTVEFFKSGEALDKSFLASIPGVESISTDGNTVRLTYTEKNVCEEVLEEGFVMVGEDQKVVGRIGQLGKVEIVVTGGKEMLEPEQLLDLLESAGMAPVLDIQTKGGTMFGIVMENAKCKELVKKRKLPLKDGLMVRVVEEAEQFHGDLGKGEELAGKMIEPFQEIVTRKPFREYTNSRLNLDPGGFGYGCKPADSRKDVNDNVIDPPMFTSDIKNGEKTEYFHTDLQKVMNKNKKREEEGNKLKRDKMNETLLTVNRSLGDSGSENYEVNFDEVSVPNPKAKEECQVEVVKMFLTPPTSKNKENSKKESAQVFQNTGESIRSLNDTTDDDDVSHEEQVYPRRENNSIQVVRMCLAPSRSVQKSSILSSSGT